MAFSVRKNVDELLADLPADGDINCIYGVRAVCTIALYLAHIVITLMFSPYSNRVVLTEVTIAWKYRVILLLGDAVFHQ
jgi:hypothetical protein